MPIHDWSRVPLGLFHHFHQDWSIEIARTLNRGRLPKGLSALVEQRAGRTETEVLTIESHDAPPMDETAGGIVTVERPVTRIIRRSSKEIYSHRANRIVVRHHLGRIVAVIEIVSPGNKGSRAALRDFVEKMSDLIHSGIHLLVVDLFPPSARDPFGIHKAVWDEIEEEDFAFPTGKDRILAAYQAGAERTAYVEPVGLGEALREMPLFIAGGLHVLVPLEETYQSAWNASPDAMRTAVVTGKLPGDGS